MAKNQQHETGEKRPEIAPGQPSPADTVPGFAKGALAATADMARYYRANMGEIWRFAVEVVPFFEPTGDRAREIRILKSDAIGTAAFDGQNWRLEFPDCCVVTGERADGPWIEHTETFQNVAWPYWGTVAGFFGGLFLSLITWHFWLWPVALLIGMAVGYRQRQTRTVTVRYRESSTAANDETFPQVWLLPDGLLVRVGSTSAKKAFVQHRVDRQTAGRDARVTVAPRHDVAPLKLDLELPETPPQKQGPPRQDLPPLSLD